jgi:hypothetical protein
MSKQVGYAEALSTRPRPGKMGPKEIRSVEVDKGEDGGHTVTHRFKQNDGGPYRESEGPHIFGASEGKKLVAHLIKHLGIKGVTMSGAEDEKD